MSLKLDVGASSYWSEIAAMQTMDNLLTQGKIDLVDYLERIPYGYISKKQELIYKLSRSHAGVQTLQSGLGSDTASGGAAMPENFPTIGNSVLKRKIIEGN